MRRMEKLFTTSSFRCIIRERKKNLSSTLRHKRAAKNRELSKNRLIAMLEELFSKSEFLEKKKILEEDY